VGSTVASPSLSAVDLHQNTLSILMEILAPDDIGGGFRVGLSAYVPVPDSPTPRVVNRGTTLQAGWTA